MFDILLPSHFQYLSACLFSDSTPLWKRFFQVLVLAFLFLTPIHFSRPISASLFYQKQQCYSLVFAILAILNLM